MINDNYTMQVGYQQHLWRDVNSSIDLNNSGEFFSLRSLTIGLFPNLIVCFYYIFVYVTIFISRTGLPFWPIVMHYISRLRRHVRVFKSMIRCECFFFVRVSMAMSVHIDVIILMEFIDTLKTVGDFSQWKFKSNWYNFFLLWLFILDELPNVGKKWRLINYFK